MPARPKKDLSQIAFAIVQAATGEGPHPTPPDAPLSPTGEFARKGGKKGGPARAKALSPERRKEIAEKAAAKRWGRQ